MSYPSRRRKAGMALVALATLLAACSGDDSNDAADTTNSTAAPNAPGTTAAPTETETETTTAESSCAPTAATFTTTESNTSVTLANADAVSLEDGAAYTTYLADFELNPDEVGGFSTPSVPPGATLVTVFVTIFNPATPPPPLSAGTTIEYSSEFGVLTFGVIAQTGTDEFNQSSNAVGELSITAVGNEFCFEVSYQDDQKGLTGLVAAPVKPD